MKRKYQSEILGVIHQDAEAMYTVGAISEAKMKEYDQDCLVPEPTPKASAVQQSPTPAYTVPGGCKQPRP
jgi:DNA-binding transcriptional regulator YiaG